MSSEIGMTDKEKDAMNHLVAFWDAYCKLPDPDGAAVKQTVCEAVHVIQGVLAIRVARRAEPEIWR